jgi:hypothetical protein
MGENSKKYEINTEQCHSSLISCITGHLNTYGPRVYIVHATSCRSHQDFMNGTGHARMCDLLSTDS